MVTFKKAFFNHQFYELDSRLTLSTAIGLGMSFGTPACDGKSLQLVGMVTGAPPKTG